MIVLLFEILIYLTIIETKQGNLNSLQVNQPDKMTEKGTLQKIEEQHYRHDEQDGNLRRNKSTITSHILPNTICKLLNNAIILINLWWSSKHEMLLVGMGLATIFSFVFGYLLIMSLNIGLTYQISRKRNNPELIGIFYQRALLINFLFCAFIITPALYLSKVIIPFFKNVQSSQNDHSILFDTVSNYLFQLVPSIYCFAFYDTTQSFLQAQGHILAPLIIQVIAVFMHLFLIQQIDAAWSKNFTDLFTAIAIYAYIVSMKKPLHSWIEWTIKCIKGWSNHMKFLQIIGLSTYLQALFFFVFSFSAYKLTPEELTCHICFINIYQILFLMFIGIKEGTLSKMGYYIKQHYYKQYKKHGVNSIKLFVYSAIGLIVFIYIYQDSICNFFIINQKAKTIFKDNFGVLSLTIFIDSFQIGVSSLLKALNKNYTVLKFHIGFYVFSLLAGYYLCYEAEYGFPGLWYGWILGILINTVCSVVRLKWKENEFRQFSIKESRKIPIEMKEVKKVENEKQMKQI